MFPGDLGISPGKTEYYSPVYAGAIHLSDQLSCTNKLCFGGTIE
jgi:hypothetical protein